MKTKDIRKKLIEYFGKEWWDEALKWLKKTFDYPETHPIPNHMLDDYHPAFRDLICSIFKIENEVSATNQLIAYSRKKDLLHMRASLLPHYLGILCPVFRSRSVNNFGLVSMKVEKGDIFSRAFYNLPFPFDQKIKRNVICCYGVTKHGKDLLNLEKYPDGGVFLINPDRDEKYEKFAKYTDYKYCTLKWRFPKNYDEFIKTLDGSVMISKSAAKKMRYKRIGYAIIRNPHPDIREKVHLIFEKKMPKMGAYLEYQEPLVDIGDETVRLASVSGYITEVELLTPQVKEDERKMWKITLEEDRDIELGCKLESPCGLKHTVAGYTDDEEPTIVINPKILKDRAIYREIKETNRVHCYPTIPGKDGNVSTRNLRISRTFVQGIFCYPEKDRKKIIDSIFTRKHLSFPYPPNLIKILKNLHRISPDRLMKKYPAFMNHFTYIRKKQVGDKLYFYEEPSAIYRTLKEFNRVKDFDKLSNYHKNEINKFVAQMMQRILLFDPSKSCQIKLDGYIRLILYHSKPEVNTLFMSEDLYEEMGKPPYVLFAKEPVTRDLSIRCLEVKVNKELPKWTIQIHPYISMDYEEDVFHTKIDTDGDLGLIMPLDDAIPEMMYNENHIVFRKLWDKYKNTTLDTVDHFKPYKDITDFLIDVYEYNREESITQLCVQTFGGIKNRAMFTDLIRDSEKWKEFVLKWDIEYQLFQAEKLRPELKEATAKQKNKYLEQILSEALSYKLPPVDPVFASYFALSSITYDKLDEFDKVVKALRKSDHPIAELIVKIWREVGLID